MTRPWRRTFSRIGRWIGLMEHGRATTEVTRAGPARLVPLRTRLTEVEGKGFVTASIAGLVGLVDDLRLRGLALHRGDRVEA